MAWFLFAMFGFTCYVGISAV